MCPAVQPVGVLNRHSVQRRSHLCVAKQGARRPSSVTVTNTAQRKASRSPSYPAHSIARKAVVRDHVEHRDTTKHKRSQGNSFITHKNGTAPCLSDLSAVQLLTPHAQAPTATRLMRFDWGAKGVRRNIHHEASLLHVQHEAKRNYCKKGVRNSKENKRKNRAREARRHRRHIESVAKPKHEEQEKR